MRARLAVAGAAVIAAVAVAVWQFVLPGGPNQPAHGGHPNAAGRPASGSPSGTVPATPGAGPPGAGWRLTFTSDFTRPQLDSTVWGTCYPWAKAAAGCTNFGNTEYQWYTSTQVRVQGGVLRLVAQRIPTMGQDSHGGSHEYACRSGMVTTYPGFHFEYGYLRVVARIPAAAGLWPALWLAAANLRWPPEIDLLEHWGKRGKTGVYFHPTGAPQVIHHLSIANLGSQWHTFALSWTPAQLVWLVDGKPVLRVSQHVPHQPMYFVADLADSAMPGGLGCDGTMMIRSVKVWQQK